MRWELQEDQIVCKFYLEHQSSWRDNISILMSELKEAGFTDRDEPSTKMRISNYEYLHAGVGLANASKQSQKVYKSLIK